MHTIRFTDIGVANVDIYASLGGKYFVDVFCFMIVNKKICDVIVTNIFKTLALFKTKESDTRFFNPFATVNHET